MGGRSVSTSSATTAGRQQVLQNRSTNVKVIHNNKSYQTFTRTKPTKRKVLKLLDFYLRIYIFLIFQKVKYFNFSLKCDKNAVLHILHHDVINFMSHIQFVK